MEDTMRVEIPAWTDQWIRGDKYGEVMRAKVIEDGELEGTEMLYVKLDKSGKSIRVQADDCKVVD
jgi:hypothetical protein